MDKKLAAAAGATLTSAAFQLSTVIWPDWIKGHKEIVWGLWIVALGCWVWWAVAHYLSIRRGEFAAAALPVPSISAPINVQVNPVFNNNPVQTNQHTVELAPPDRPSEPLKSTLEILKPVFVSMCPVPGLWRPSHSSGSVLGVVAWIHNPTAEEGEIGELVRSARASLAYRKEDGQLSFTIDTAYWLDESAYEIDIRPGMTRGIVLALFPAGMNLPYWFGSENRRRHRVAVSRPGTTLYVSSPKYVNFAVPKEIEISIVSKQRTVRKLTILVGRDPGGSYEFTLGGV